jgi:hypothetical protein
MGKYQIINFKWFQVYGLNIFEKTLKGGLHTCIDQHIALSGPNKIRIAPAT